MKKIILLFVSALMIFTLVSCGGGKSATVTLKDGTTEEITAKELATIYDENKAKFESTYTDAPISFEGTVNAVDGHYEQYLRVDVYEIYFKEGWVLQIPKGSHEDIVNNLEEGTKLKVTSSIKSAFGDEINVSTMYYIHEWADKDKIEVI